MLLPCLSVYRSFYGSQHRSLSTRRMRPARSLGLTVRYSGKFRSAQSVQRSCSARRTSPHQHAGMQLCALLVHLTRRDVRSASTQTVTNDNLQQPGMATTRAPRILDKQSSSLLGRSPRLIRTLAGAAINTSLDSSNFLGVRKSYKRRAVGVSVNRHLITVHTLPSPTQS